MTEEQDIRTLSLEQVWKVFLIEKGEDAKAESIYKEARFGSSVSFDMYDYLNGNIQTKPKSGHIIIRGKSMDLEKFWTELEEREKLIKKYLLSLSKKAFKSW